MTLGYILVLTCIINLYIFIRIAHLTPKSCQKLMDSHNSNNNIQLSIFGHFFKDEFYGYLILLLSSESQYDVEVELAKFHRLNSIIQTFSRG